MTTAKEHIKKGHYEVQEVPYGKVYKWVPGHALVEDADAAVEGLEARSRWLRKRFTTLRCRRTKSGEGRNRRIHTSSTTSGWSCKPLSSRERNDHLLDRQHTNTRRRVNDAAQEYAQSTLEPYRTLWDHYFAEAHERQEEGRWAKYFLEDNMEHLRTQAERDLNSSEELVERTRRWQEEAVRILAEESANAYEGFLDSLFLYYRQSVRAG